MTIEAGQLIFTRVETAYSKQRRSGYQTVYRSPSISQADVTMIEKRIQCCRLVGDRRRLQFLVLESGNIMLSVTSSIETNQEIIDRTGRTGVFLVHCLVLNKQDLAYLDNNPFRIFEGLSGVFITSFDEFNDIIEVNKPATLDIPPLRFDPPGYAGSIGEDWSDNPAGLDLLYKLAENAREVKSRNRLVLMYGDNDAIEDTLKLVFQYLQPHQRLDCTFDTLIDQCPTPPGIYWAAGSSMRLSGSQYIPASMSDHKVTMADNFLKDAGNDPYSLWRQYMNANGRTGEIAGYAETVKAAIQALTSKRPSLLRNADPTALESFYNANQKRMDELLKKAVDKSISMFSRGFQEQIREWLASNESWGAKFQMAAEEALSAPLLRQCLTDLLQQPGAQSGDVIQENDRKPLQALARQLEDPLLLFRTAVYTDARRVDHTARQEALRRLNEADVRREFERLHSSFESPVEIFITSERHHLDAILSYYQAHRIDDETLVMLVQALMKAGHGAELKRYAANIAPLESGPLRQIEQAIQSKDVAADFYQAVQTRRQQLKVLHPSIMDRAKDAVSSLLGGDTAKDEPDPAPGPISSQYVSEVTTASNAPDPLAHTQQMPAHGAAAFDPDATQLEEPLETPSQPPAQSRPAEHEELGPVTQSSDYARPNVVSPSSHEKDIPQDQDHYVKGDPKGYS